MSLITWALWWVSMRSALWKAARPDTCTARATRKRGDRRYTVRPLIPLPWLRLQLVKYGGPEFDEQSLGALSTNGGVCIMQHELGLVSYKTSCVVVALARIANRDCPRDPSDTLAYCSDECKAPTGVNGKSLRFLLCASARCTATGEALLTAV